MQDQLEALKKTFGGNKKVKLAKLLQQISRRRYKDALSLIRLHESLLFMLAYPQNEALLKGAMKILASFPARIKYLKKINADLTPFETPEMAGIASIALTTMPGYNFARWISMYHANNVEIDWQYCEEEERLGATLPRILPLLEEEALVESHLPFTNYIQVAKKNTTDLAWLMKNFSRLPISEKQKAELFESLKLFIRFTPDFDSSRTGLKLARMEIFYHDTPLIQRSGISIQDELGAPALKINKLPVKKGKGILDIIRTASVVRYRELHGFIWADPKSFIEVEAGRGVTVYINEVLPENRLPLRAYHSGFIFKNGIPVGYIEGLSLFEKMEVGFNLYYTFREGETAWLYIKLLRIFKQLLGVTVFAVDPYQVGHGNEEGIQSGAFWFYRKLGFYPVLDGVAKMVEKEEKKMVSPAYRTPASLLRKMATSYLYYLYERTPGHPVSIQNPWKDFQIRNILLSLQKKMSQKFNGDPARMKEAAGQLLSRSLNIKTNNWPAFERESFNYMAIILSGMRGISKWSNEEKKSLIQIIRAKGGSGEAHYLFLMQNHPRLREIIIGLGCD